MACIMTKLEKRILEWCKIKDIGQAIVDGTELIMRLRLGQLDVVAKILEIYKHMPTIDIHEPLYRANELGEYIKCLQEHPNCQDVDGCWITRKGFSKCRKKIKN